MISYLRRNLYVPLLKSLYHVFNLNVKILILKNIEFKAFIRDIIENKFINIGGERDCKKQ